MAKQRAIIKFTNESHHGAKISMFAVAKVKASTRLYIYRLPQISCLGEWADRFLIFVFDVFHVRIQVFLNFLNEIFR